MRGMIDGPLEFSRIEESGATVEIGSLPTVRDDRTRLERLFSNLIGNAIEYRGNESLRVEVDATKRGLEWRLAVADNGIGIDPEYHDQIFDVFNRLHAIGEFPGSGIGLALCRRIVTNHGGEIGVDSEPDEGTTFTVTLPAAAPDA